MLRLPIKLSPHIFLHPTSYFVLAATLFLLHASLYTSWLGFDAVDDAYISFHYARNAAQGYGLTFNIGEQAVEGYTNFLWTVLMIPSFWLNLPVHLTALGLGLFWALGSIILVRFSFLAVCPRYVTTPTPVESWLVTLAVLLLAMDGSFALWAVGGLESPLFAFLVLAGGLAYLREMQTPDTLPLSGVWFALAAMTRPEGILIYGLTGLHQLAARLLRDHRVANRQDWLRLGLFVLLWLPWFTLRWQYYGFLWPNTFYAKIDFNYAHSQYERGLAHLQTFIGVHLGYWPLFIALLPLLERRWRMWSSYFTLIIVAYGTYIIYVGGDWSVGRFFVPLLSMFYILLAGGLIIAGQRFRERMGRPAVLGPVGVLAAVVVVVGLALGFFIQSSLNGEKLLFIDKFQAGLASRARVEMGLWLHENLPRNAYIAVDAAGQLPFYADLKAIDLYGLTNLTIAHGVRDAKAETIAGHDKVGIHYIIFIAKPDYIIVYGESFDWLGGLGYDRVYPAWTSQSELYEFLNVYEKHSVTLTANYSAPKAGSADIQPDTVPVETTPLASSAIPLADAPLLTIASAPPRSRDAPTPTVTPALRPPDENPLTGLKVDDVAALRRRPLMVRVGNDPVARPQVALNKADIVYEELVEGWVTRFTAIYLSQDPEMIAPIRSARLINLQLSPQYQGVLASSGGSDPVRWELSQSDIINLDEYFVPQPYFYRENEGWQRRLALDAGGAREYLHDQGLERAVGLRGFVFDKKLDVSSFPEEAVGAAKEVVIPYPRQTSEARWQYNQKSRAYLRFSSGEPMLNFDGSQITATNVIIYFAKHQKTDIVEDSNGATSVRIIINGLNTAWLLRDGNILKGNWRSNGHETPEFIFNDGRPMPLKPGNTWIEVVPLEYLIDIDGTTHARLDNGKGE